MTDLSQARWRRSSRSNNNCVEVATNLPGVIAIRDSKDPHGPALTVSAAEWRALLAALER